MANEKALRIIAAALLSSDLTSSELRRLNKDLGSPDFFEPLRNILYHTSGTENSTSGRETSHDYDAEELLEFIQRKKMPKSVARQFMETIDNRISRLSGDATMRELAADFTSRGSDKVQHFVNLVSNGAKGDPYLRGIIDRSNR